MRANVAGLRETRFRFQRYFNCDFVTSPSDFQNPILSAEEQLRDRTSHRANRSKLMIYVKGLFEQLQPVNVQTMKCDKAACYDSWTKRGSHALVAPCPRIVFLPFFLSATDNRTVCERIQGMIDASALVKQCFYI